MQLAKLQFFRVLQLLWFSMHFWVYLKNCWGFLYDFCSFYPWQKVPKSTDGAQKNVVFCKRIIILVVVQMLARARKWLGVDKKMEGEILTIPKVPNRKLFENAQITSIKGHVTSSWKFHPRIWFKFFCSIIACRTQQNKNDNF